MSALTKQEEPSTLETIGDYHVHPIAAMFPTLEGEEFEKFKFSIRDRGQQIPIIIQGDQLIDGRNRLRACLELGLDPITQAYDGKIPVDRYILTVNLSRRHLTADQRVEITSKAMRWMAARINRDHQRTGKSADGTAGGRGHKREPERTATPPAEPSSASAVEENLCLDSSTGLSKRDWRDVHARSTVGQIAEAAKVSPYKAAQAILVADYSPELADRVIRGEIQLREAVKQIPRTPKSKRKRVAVFSLEIAIQRSLKSIRKHLAACPQLQRRKFLNQLQKEIAAL